MTSTVITRERPDHPDAIALIAELEAHLAGIYPVESRHGFSVQKLLNEGVAFFVLRAEGRPAGCGGVLLVGRDYAELKRLYVRPEFRGRRFGEQLVERLAAHARAHGIHLLRLETGSEQRQATRLYERLGFHVIPPFGPYREDGHSLCYEKSLAPE